MEELALKRKEKVVSKENLAEYNRLRREIDKRRGQIDSLNKCIEFHCQKIQTTNLPSTIGKEERSLRNRIFSKRSILSEISSLEKTIKRIR